MLIKVKLGRNTVFQLRENMPFSSRVDCSALNADEAIPQFTVLSTVQVRMISFAKHQRTQTNSYTREYLSEDGENKIDQNASFYEMSNTIISICFGISKYLCIHNYIVPGQILGLFETRISDMFTY